MGKYDDAIGGGKITIDVFSILEEDGNVIHLEDGKTQVRLTATAELFEQYNQIVQKHGSTFENDLVNYMTRVVQKYAELHQE